LAAVIKNALSRTGTFSSKANERERKNERSSTSIERDAVEKRRDDATRDESRDFEGLAKAQLGYS
jgi:hypothetical protein